MRALLLALFVLVAPAAAAQELLRLSGEPYDAHRSVHFFATHPAQPQPDGTWLVVALHGCHQDARGYFHDGGWADMARQKPIAVLVPEFTGRPLNPAHCWEWWEEPEVRGALGTQSATLADAIQAYRGALGAGPTFVTGLSAGAAMAQVLAGTWPQRFQAAAMVAGVPYGCSLLDGPFETTCKDDGSCRLSLRYWLDWPWAYPRFTEAASCMEHGFDAAPAVWAGLPGLYGGDTDGPWPAVLIVQGAADPTVDCRNAREMAEQWAALHGIEAPAPPCDRSLPVFGQGVARAGRAPVEVITIRDLAHAQPVTPGCGRADPDRYTATAPICAAEEAMRFFGAVTPPSAASR